ncbi:MAG: hypothetical protein CVV44_14410 [Spirochaetae bacterium HGW-Spirochaetae-1]|jgi:biopolymer transport protein ExbB|nr:MAG: hypothetical protein CVV44_14410 [Spirochaetae bacterium HGW-Spirochaetae-1]
MNMRLSLSRIIFSSVLLFSTIMGLGKPVMAQVSDPAKTPVAAAIETGDTVDTVVNEDNSMNGAELNNDESALVQGNSLFTTVKQGGPLMILLVLLGIGSLTIIIERLIFFTRNRVWKYDQLDSVLAEAAKDSKAQYREDLEDDLRSYFQIYTHGVEKGLALLSGIGNLAPIFGFLGTVIGMIQAFASIAAAATVNAKVVAVGIQVALITTAGGLIVAAPTLGFYYLFMHILQNRTARAEEIIGAACEKLPRLSDRICRDI